MNMLRASTFIRRPRPTQLQRAFHQATAELITLNAQGRQETTVTGIWLGDNHEAFTLIPPDIGKALARLPFQYKDDTYPLVFDHDSRHFAHRASSPYPRLLIPQQLPRQGAGQISPATMYCYGVNYNISLDDTVDAKFAKDAQNSAKKLKGALELLKNM